MNVRKLTILLAFTALAVSTLSAGDNKSANAKELKKFQGTWQATQISINGAELDADIVKKTTITITGKKYTMVFNGKTKLYGKYTIDVSTNPKTMDAMVTDANGKTTKLEGMFQWQDGKRQTCHALPGYQRPGEILQKKGYVVLEWEQKKKKK